MTRSVPPYSLGGTASVNGAICAMRIKGDLSYCCKRAMTRAPVLQPDAQRPLALDVPPRHRRALVRRNQAAVATFPVDRVDLQQDAPWTISAAMPTSQLHLSAVMCV